MEAWLDSNSLSKTEVEFTYSEIYKSQGYCLLSFDTCIPSCNPHPIKGYISTTPAKFSLLLSFDYCFPVCVEIELHLPSTAEDFYPSVLA